MPSALYLAHNAWAAGWDLKGLILQHWNGTAWK